MALLIRQLPPAVRTLAIKYVRKSCGQVIQIDPKLMMRLDDFSLVLLPPPSTALGIDAPDVNGSVLHF